MYAALTLLNEIFKTFFDSLKKDLGASGFEMVLIIALNSWAGGLLIIWLLATGQFQMPTDPLFYACWIGLALLTEISFALMLSGMLKTTFFVATSLSNISFVMTSIYAALFLQERFSSMQIVAIIVAAIGTLLFFKNGFSKKYFSENKGLFLILFSLLLTPLEYVLYKAATEYTTSYSQFLTGRLVMDLVCYTLFFIIVFLFYYRKNPFPRIWSLISSRSGLAYLAGHTFTELLESWLIFQIPISLFTMLGTLSIPTSYFVGKRKYREFFNWRYVIGGALIALGVVLFLI